MAKDNSEESIGVGSKILSFIITLLIICILLGILVACVKLDVGGIGNNLLRPVIKDVPVLNNILPKASDQQISQENNYTYDNIADAVEKIKELEKENDKLREENDDINSKVSDLKTEVKRLKVFEEQQLEYEKNVKQFNEDIVFNDNAPEISEYKSYYEMIEPENASSIYRQVIEQLQADETITELAGTYSKMEPSAAAKALEQNDNLSLVCKILTNMSQKAMAQIMDQMSADYAAKVTKKINSSSGAN